jgi:hypothetical protein
MMKKQLTLLFAVVVSLQLSAHDLHQGNAAVREWHLKGKSHRHLKASFFLMRNDTVYLEDLHGEIRHLPLAELSANDRKFVLDKQQRVEALNRAYRTAAVNGPKPVRTDSGTEDSFPYALVSYLFSGSLAGVVLLRLIKGRRRHALPLCALATVTALAGFTRQQQHTIHTVTNPLFLDSAFAYFHPEVNTFWDSTYFHVESKGIPLTHEMMAGITKWQQQVPIPQCYIGNNSWSIPLNPVLAQTPVPVSPQHFIRGAVAVAVNGVPIFNPYTNTGVDAYLDGQLDNYGGHSGRADDYHYHTAPLHLYGTVPSTLPVAFALDGYAVYGSSEPNGSPMAPLDTNNGHFGSNGVYHYHGVAAAPYMIGYMVGQVTEDTTLQIVPQARAFPVRPSLTPLNGAVLTGHRPNGLGNGYTLTYTLSGQIDSIEYHWSQTGQYQYNFYTAGTGIPVTQNYNGFSQCSVPTSVAGSSLQDADVRVYPNPAAGVFKFTFPTDVTRTSIRSIAVYSMDGTEVYRADSCPDEVDASAWNAGSYFVVLSTGSSRIIRKVIVR